MQFDPLMFLIPCASLPSSLANEVVHTTFVFGSATKSLNSSILCCFASHTEYAVWRNPSNVDFLFVNLFFLREISLWIVDLLYISHCKVFLLIFVGYL